MKDLIILSREAPEEAEHALSEYGEVLRLPPDPALAAPVASHPDMTVFSHGGEAVAPRGYLELFPAVARAIRGAGAALIASDAPRGAEYPLDVGLNCLCAGNFLFCRKASAAPEVLRLAEAHGLTVVPVNQGYAACSSLAAGGAIVTADPSVAGAAEAVGLDVLRIAPGHVALPGYGTGFIGGASGVIGDTVFFFGDPATHPDGGEIAAFLAERGFLPVSLFPGPLTDFGGIRIIRKKSAGSK